MEKFSTILFDVDGTLLDFHKTEKVALENTFVELNIDICDKNVRAYSQINESLWKLLENEKIDKDKLKIERFKLFFEKINVNRDENLASETYINHLSQSFFLMDGAIDLCKYLSDKFTLAIVTNGIAKVQHSRIKLSGLKQFFPHVFISDEVGYPKPQKEYFDHVFNKLNIDNLKDIIIVGDSLSSDIKGGNNANIATCWYNPTGESNDTDSICDYEIKKLCEIKEIII